MCAYQRMIPKVGQESAVKERTNTTQSVSYIFAYTNHSSSCVDIFMTHRNCIKWKNIESKRKGRVGKRECTKRVRLNMNSMNI